MKRPILILFLLALAARLLVFGSLLFHYGPGSFYLANDGTPLSDNDSQNYVTIAKNLVEGNGFSRFAEAPFEPDSFRTPLLAFYFVPFVYAFGFSKGLVLAMFVLNIILAGTPVAAFYVAKLFIREKYAFWTGVLVALEPLLAYRTNIAEPDALIVLLLLAAVYFFVLYWRNPQAKYLYLTAIFLGVLTLAKPVGLYLPLFFGIFAAGRLPPLKALAIFFLIFGSIIFPWAYRNKSGFGTWGISSVAAYNFYNYYTDNLPVQILIPPTAGREPARNLGYSKQYLAIARKRIWGAPRSYVKRHLVGTIRNFFASDLPGIYHNGHTRILPFVYNPVTQENFTNLLLAGKYKEFVEGSFSGQNRGFIIRHAGFTLFYLVILISWLRSYNVDRQIFHIFALFLLLTFYFVFAAGTFVDAKYRLPAVPLLLIMFFYFLNFKLWKRES